MSQHPEHEAEQAYIQRAHDEYARALADVEGSLEWALADKKNPDAMALAANLTTRVRQLAAAGNYAPCFARLDDEDGSQLYIGRQHIADADQNPVVIDWRAPVAAPFYRATPLDPMGCVLRRQFMLEELELVEIYDTDLTDPNSSVGVPDPLLAEINRARTGRMREVVSTIQIEQDEIVRARRDQPLFVQGGPGTGKTVVGLHRAAYLLYEHRNILSTDGVLVLGPNERFIEYISDVLPQLGERTVRQATLFRLLDTRRQYGQSVASLEVDRLRTDGRMATLIDLALRRLAVLPVDDLRVRGRFGGSTIVADASARLMAESLEKHAEVGVARQTWVAGVVRELFRGLTKRDSTSISEYATEVKRDADFKRYIDTHWKSTTETQAFALMARTLKAAPQVASQAGFSEAEVSVLAAHGTAKPADGLDLVLLDEIKAALGKRIGTFGHVILDEAQDLSPMELRAVGRRIAGGSITVLGDLAQSTGLHTYASWEAVAAHMLPPAADQRDAGAAADAPAMVSQLSVGYRVPAEFMEVANRLLPMMRIDLAPTGFIRSAGQPAQFHLVEADAVGPTAASLANELAGVGQTVAVIGPRPILDELVSAGALDGSVVVLTPAESKGLEFEGVVLVEPSLILAEQPAGMNKLFVALTRALQDLHLVGEARLPDGLMEGIQLVR